MTEAILWKRTHCSRMDHGGCSLLVGVRGNRIVDIKGDPGGFLNKGDVCPKGRDRTHGHRSEKNRIGGKGEIPAPAAAGQGISDNDEIVIETKAGSITQVARVTDRIHPRVVNAAFGFAFRGFLLKMKG